MQHRFEKLQNEHKAKFYKRLYCKSGFLNDVFWAFLWSDLYECVIRFSSHCQL